MAFYMNGYLWTIEFIDPFSPELIDRTGEQRVATTDPLTHTVYLSNLLHGDFLQRVLLHELGHCVMISYGLLDEIHRMIIPKYWIEMEEWICNFIADYGKEVFRVAHSFLGDSASDEIEKTFK